MRTIETTIYKYSELSESAQETARNWYRRATDDDNFFAECVFEDAATIADLMGIDLCQTRFTRMDGTHGYNPTIYYSGFWSQGDGASFECEYRYKPGSVKSVMRYAPKDETLHRIARELQAIQKRHFYKLCARSKVSGHYVHSGCMDVDAWHGEDQYRDIGEAESNIRDCLRSFADWIYSRLENEYEYQNSDGAIAEQIQCNEYEFTEEGKLV